MISKLLVVCGPTATGKTNLALSLAQKYNGEIVSADSRQVFRGLDIGTGKDLPKDSQLNVTSLDLGGFYLVDGVKLWGYDLAEPEEEFSVFHYLRFAEKIIKNIHHRGKLPIVTGGTGLYIKGIVDGIQTSGISKNEKIRAALEGKTVDKLFERLARMDAIKAASMNTSDKKNPRRLIRAIEVADARIKRTNKIGTSSKDFDTLFVCLSAPEKYLLERITNRVDARIQDGIENELIGLFKLGLRWDDMSMNSLGYKEWKGFFEGQKTRKEVVAQWRRNEFKYSKRQIVWFKKDKRLEWFDITKKDFQKNVEKLVKKWYRREI